MPKTAATPVMKSAGRKRVEGKFIYLVPGKTGSIGAPARKVHGGKRAEAKVARKSKSMSVAQ